MIIINVKSFLKIHFFAGFQLPVFENKRTFIKKAVLHATTLMHPDLNTVYAVSLVITKEIARNNICGRSY